MARKVKVCTGPWSEFRVFRLFVGSFQKIASCFGSPSY